MKACQGMEVWIIAFVVSALDGYGWLASLLIRDPLYLTIGVWVQPRTGLDTDF